MYFCVKCGKELKTPHGKSVHEKYCDGHGTKLDLIKEKKNEVCPKCGQRILASKQKHYNSCDGTGPRRSKMKKGYNPWNKGLTYENGLSKLYGKNDGTIKAIQYKNKISKALKGKNLGRKMSEEQKEKLRKNSKIKIVKRSKNEIYFAELCKKHFNVVLTNEPMFNGWDADVILVNEKIAILWNGVWHYKQITEQHSVKQVQNRDKIKLNEIKKCGFSPYIIKDMGKHNKEFVKTEFNKLINSALAESGQ